jgi:hypothetical protein
MTNLVTIDRKLGGDALRWAKANCKGYITNDYHQDGYYTYHDKKLDFFFANKKDALMIMLRWAG